METPNTYIPETMPQIDWNWQVWPSYEVIDDLIGDKQDQQKNTEDSPEDDCYTELDIQ